MKLHSISYIVIEGESIEWFSSKSAAEKRRKEVIKENKNNSEFVGCAFVKSFTIEINKKGIIDFLNNVCGQRG